MTTAKSDAASESQAGQKFFFWVDDTEYRTGDAELTVAEIRTIAGVPADIPLVIENPDGSERQIAEDETFDLKPGRRFMKSPRFKRG